MEYTALSRNRPPTGYPAEKDATEAGADEPDMALNVGALTVRRALARIKFIVLPK